MFTCFVSGVLAAYISPSSPAAAQKNLGLYSKRLSQRQCSLSAGSPPASLPPWPASCGPWTGGHVVCTVSFYFFSLPSPQRTMTLKSNKNEPAVTLESVNSVRTALSDLYLEQLIQNKPKSDKVLCLFFLFFLFSSLFCAPRTTYCVLACFRDLAMRHMNLVCFATISLKIDLASVFMDKLNVHGLSELQVSACSRTSRSVSITSALLKSALSAWAVDHEQALFTSAYCPTSHLNSHDYWEAASCSTHFFFKKNLH